jgi:hypothetical protein
MDPCKAGVIDAVMDASELAAIAALAARSGRAVSTLDAAAGISNGLDLSASPERGDVEGVGRPAGAGRLQAPIPNVSFWRAADDLVR